MAAAAVAQWRWHGMRRSVHCLSPEFLNCLFDTWGFLLYAEVPAKVFTAIEKSVLMIRF